MPTSDDNHDNSQADAPRVAGARTAADEEDKTEQAKKAVDKQQSPPDTTTISLPKPQRELQEKLQNLEDKVVQERATVPGAVAVSGSASSDKTPSPKPQMALQKNLQNLEDKVLQERATIPGAVAMPGNVDSATAHAQAQQNLQKLEEKALHERATQPGAVAVSGPGSSNPLAQNLRNLEGKVLQDRATVPGAVAVSGAASSGTQTLAQHLQNLEGKVLQERATQPGAVAVSGSPPSSGAQALAQHLQNLEGKVLEQDRATQPGAVAVSGGLPTNTEDAATNKLARHLQNLEGKVLEQERATQPGAVAVSGSATNLKTAPPTKQQIDAEIARTKVIARHHIQNLEDKLLQDRSTLPGAVAVPGTVQPIGVANNKQQIDNEFARVNALAQQRLQNLEGKVLQERATHPGAVAVSGAPAKLKEPPDTNPEIDSQLGPSSALAQQHLQNLEGKVLQDRAILPGAVAVSGVASNLKNIPCTKQQLEQEIASVNAQVQLHMQNLEEKVLQDRATLPGAAPVAGSAPKTKKSNDIDRQIDNEIARTNALLQQQRLEKDLHAIEEKMSQEKATEPGAFAVSASTSASSTKSEDVKRRIDKEFARTSAYAREHNLCQMERDVLDHNNLAFVSPTNSCGGSKLDGMLLGQEIAANLERQEETATIDTMSTLATLAAIEQDGTHALETPVPRPEGMLAGTETAYHLERIERKIDASPQNESPLATATQAQMEVIDAKMANGMHGSSQGPGVLMQMLEEQPNNGPKHADIAGLETETRSLDARLGLIAGGISDEMSAINNPRANQIDRKHPMYDASAQEGTSNLVEATPVVEDGAIPVAFGTPENDDEAAAERAELRAKTTKRLRRTTIFSILFCLVLGIVLVVTAVTTDGFRSGNEDSLAEISNTPTGSPTLAPTPYIVSLPEFTLVAMEDPDSPQSLAYQWMQEDPLLAEHSDSKLSQRLALATLYFATNGDSWILNNDWLSYEVDECFWFNKFNITSGDHAVELSPTAFFTTPDQLTDVPICDKDGTFLALVLSLNGLSGKLPPEVSMLSKLELLALANNEELAGTIATEFGKMTDMRELSLGNTKITGSIPSEIGFMRDLEYLILREVPISGSLPSEIGGIASLKQLEVMRTQVTGTIPIEYYNLQSINFFGLYRNKLTGSLPTEVGLLSNSVEIFRVDTNNFSGSIPTELGCLSRLNNLNLKENGFSGIIPTELGNLQGLEQLWLEANFLTSTIPSVLGSLSNLTALVLADLLLTGTVPLSVWMLPKQFGPEISRNPFLEGSIPTEIGVVGNFGALFVYEMGDSWSGTIPSELGLQSNIAWVWLHQSNLEGTIPEEVGSLSALTQLRLHDNNLTGTFPAPIGSAPNLEFLTLNGTQLTGEVPEDACSIQNLYFDCLMMCGCECAC